MTPPGLEMRAFAAGGMLFETEDEEWCSIRA